MTATATALNIQRAAIEEIRRGYSVVPVPPRQKGPTLPEWQKLRLSVEDVPSYFGQEENLGRLNGEPSGLVDVDLDCPEALAVADRFLPKTGMIHGRPGKPRSHRWYAPSPIPSTRQFKDINGTMLVELRSTGGQTVIPPSIHPSGEVVAWDSTGDPTGVHVATLQQAVAHVAAVALLARHWPVKGSRHDVFNALAGFLLPAEWLPERATDFIEALIIATRDEEGRDRLASVRSTIKTLAAGRQATGGPRLAELLSDGQLVIDRVREWLGIRPPEKTQSNMTVAAWPTLPPAALYGLPGEIVRAVEPFTEADPVAVLVNILVAFGNLVGRGPGFLVDNTRHHLNLFAVLVGPTGQGRKGQAWSTPRMLCKLVDEEWATARCFEGLSSGEGLINAVRDPTYRTERNRKTGQTESVLVDEGIDDKRLLSVEGEFSQVLKVGIREGNILSPTIRRAWDGADVLSPLVKTNPIRATGAHISIIGHITQEELLRNLTETDAANGWCNRFLWLLVRRSKYLPDGIPPPKDLVQRLAYRLGEAVTFAGTGADMTRDAGATDLWRNIYRPLSTPRPGLVGAVCGRAEAQVMRLAAIYALLDRSFVIRKGHLLAALAVWDYCEQSALAIFGERLGDWVADTCWEVIRGAGAAGLTQTALHTVFGRNLGGGRLRAALQSLLALGLIVARPGEPTGGRPVTRWCATPGTMTNLTKETNKGG